MMLGSGLLQQWVSRERHRGFPGCRGGNKHASNTLLDTAVSSNTLRAVCFCSGMSEIPLRSQVALSVLISTRFESSLVKSLELQRLLVPSLSSGAKQLTHHPSPA